MAQAFVGWLEAHDGGGLDKAVRAFGSLAATAKGLQFSLARAARGRAVDLGRPFEDMTAAWDTAMDVLGARYGR
jgi:hypothetical protein